MVLPGKSAAEVRVEFAKIIRGYVRFEVFDNNMQSSSQIGECSSGLPLLEATSTLSAYSSSTYWTVDTELRDKTVERLKGIVFGPVSSNPEDAPQISKKPRVEIVEEPKEASPIPEDLPAADREDVVVDAMRKFFAKEFEECARESLSYEDIFHAFSESFCIASGRDEEIFSQQCQPLLNSQFPFVLQGFSDKQRNFFNVRRKLAQ